MNNSVKVNSFVKRQLKKSGKTYSKLSFNKIAEYAEIQIKKIILEMVIEMVLLL